jgi:hypothetical protein
MRLYSTGGKFNALASKLVSGFFSKKKKELGFLIPNLHRSQLGLLGYLIPIATLAFIPHRQSLPRIMPSPLALPLV